MVASVAGCGGDAPVECQPGLALCGDGQCHDLQSDAESCGACDHRCTFGERCSAGVCGGGCPVGTSACGTACVDLTRDAAHCGACDTACAAPATCVDGACQPSACSSGFYASGDTCLPCSSGCAAGQYQTAACSATADRTCAACTAIPNCTVESCTTSSDQVCTDCSAGTWLSGGSCVSCSGACPGGQYQTTACSPTADRTCAACTPIANCAVESCSTSSDQVCTACGANSYLIGAGCASCSGACPVGQYQTAACSATADRTCAACGAVANCATVSCTTGSDQTCVTCAAGFGDCANGAADGCETALTANPAHCGACGTVCAASGEACVGGSCVPSDTDCYALHLDNPLLGDGVYTLDPDGAGGADPFSAYCDMTTNGGGWTLLMKIDGNQTTFTYASSLWTDATTYQPDQSGYDHTSETKLAGFGSMPLNAMRIGMYDPRDSQTRWLELAQANSSLLELFNSGYQALSLGRAAWEGLMATPSLQPNCNQEGFNVFNIDATGTNVRIGIIGNNENDCISSDSRLGIGTSGDRCGQDTGHSAGNETFCGGDYGDLSVATFSYVMVRDCPGGVCDCGALTSCDSLCVDTNSDPERCGSCTNACPALPYANPGCSGGVCGLGACFFNFGNCDANPANGCETDLRSDNANCGGCGVVCTGADLCQQGACVTPTLTIVNPNGVVVEYQPRNWGNNQDPAEGSCSGDCTVLPTRGNNSQMVRLRSSGSFVSGCDQRGDFYNYCYVSLPATVVVN